MAIAISGTDVYVGGNFTNAAGIAEADWVAKWNGTAWSALGDNGPGNGALTAGVRAIAISGTDVYVGGDFTNAAGIAEADYLAKWNGTAWSALGDNSPGSGALNSTVYGIGITGTDVYVGGGFTDAAGITDADAIAKWNGTTWSAVGTAWGSTSGAQVYAIGFVGSDVYVGGYFTDLGSIPEADWIAKWDGAAWSALGSNGSGDGALNQYVMAVASSGTEIYVGGAFTNAAGIPEADRIAKWNGSAWSALGSNGVGVGAITSDVAGLAVSGTDLYVGGAFTNAAGIAEADRIAKWDGTEWSALGSNGAGDGALDQNYTYVNAVAISGTDLYAGGNFTNAAGIAEADYVASYDDGAGASASTLTLSTKEDRVPAGETVALRAHVTGDGDAPTGKVIFRVGNATGKKLGFCELNTNGRCTLRTDEIPRGTRFIWARYAGDDAYLPATTRLPLRVVAAALPAPEPTPVAPEPTPDPGASPAPEPTPDPGASPAPSPAPGEG